LERESDSCAVEKQQEESMRGSDLRTGELFSYVDLEQRVPESLVCKSLEVLDGGCEVKLVARAGEAS
jgi:hypothetical protein